jgi:hypothetical protein
MSKVKNDTEELAHAIPGMTKCYDQNDPLPSLVLYDNCLRQQQPSSFFD